MTVITLMNVNAKQHNAVNVVNNHAAEPDADFCSYITHGGNMSLAPAHPAQGLDVTGAETPPNWSAGDIGAPGYPPLFGHTAAPSALADAFNGVRETGGGMQHPANLINTSALTHQAAARHAVALTHMTAHPVEGAGSRPVDRLEVKDPSWKVLLTPKNLTLTVRTVTLAVSVASLLLSVALLAGAAMGPLLIVVAAGLVLGALVGLFANSLSEHFAEVVLRGVENKSCKTQAMGGGVVAVTAAVLHNASKRGVARASFFGWLSTMCGAKSGRPRAGIAGANANGVAIGTVDTLAGGRANDAMQTGAGIGGALGGWTLNSIQGSAEVGEYAAYGAHRGALWGAMLDDYLLGLVRMAWWQLSHARERGYGISSGNLIMGWLRSGDTEAGKMEYAGAATVASIFGVGKAIDIRTDGEVTKAIQAVDTARYTVSIGALVRAARNYLEPGADGQIGMARPAGGEAHAVHSDVNGVSWTRSLVNPLLFVRNCLDPSMLPHV